MKFFMKHKAILMAAGCLSCAIVMFGLFCYAKAAEKRITIPNGISINGIEVSGMTRQEAIDALAPEVEKYKNASITLVSGNKQFVCNGQDLSVDMEVDAVVDQALNFGQTGNIIERYQANKLLESASKKEFKIAPSVSGAAISAFLSAHMGEIEEAPVNYGLTRENGAFQIVDGTAGYTVDVATGAQEISDFITTQWTGEDTSIPLTTTVVEPAGSPEELALVTDKMGTYTTDYSTSAAGRKQNVANGASKVNGTVLYPGEQISIGAKLNPISLENGYAMAGAYENGTTVEAVGGGVCQISSTIYNAVIRAELQIDERYPHSMTVHYVDPSADAAIAGDYKDLKFTNNTEYPIYLELITTGSTITCNVYGHDVREAGRSVDFVSEIVEKEEWTKIYNANSTRPVGYLEKTITPYTGYKAKLVKIVYMNGVEQSREDFNSSKYKKIDAQYDVGIATAAGASGEMQAAIATQDEATIRATMAALTDPSFFDQRNAEVNAEEAAAAAEEAAKTETEANASTESPTASSETTSSTTDGN